MDNVPATNSNLAIALYFLFKTIPYAVSGFSIYLGYKLFILGVTGAASIVIEAHSIGGQLLNAAPGLFFAVGGIAALIAAIVKGISVKWGAGNSN